MIALTPERQLLFAALRRAFGDGHREEATVRPHVDWGSLTREARDQGVLALLYAGLESLDVDVPAEVRATLRRALMAELLQSRSGFESVLERTLEALQGAGLDPIVLKGGALAYVAYSAPHHRGMSDIDLLLPLAHLDRAGQVLHTLGFLQVQTPHSEGHHHLPPFVWPATRFVVELHHSLLEDNPFAIDLDQFCARSQVRQLGRTTGRVLTPEDSLLHVAVHLAFGHHYERYPLRSLVDVYALARAGLDWDAFVRSVQRTRTAGAVYWPLRLSRTWLAAEIPDAVLARLAPAPSLRRLLEPVLLSSYVLDRRAPEGPGTAVLYRLLLELSLYTGCSLLVQARALWRTVFPPPAHVTHVPDTIARSRMRYLALLLEPGRISRGVQAAGRLMSSVTSRA